MPRVSIIIPAYNRADLLPRVAGTVLAQTFTDFEMIIVDDGSHDGTRDVALVLCECDPRVRYIHQTNSGPSAARNTGISAAQGDFLAFLDADDLWETTKLEKQLAIMEQDSAIGVVYCDWSYIDADGRTSPGIDPPDLGMPTMYESLLYYNVVHGSASAVLIRSECFDRVGLFDETLRYAEDWDMWTRIAEHYQFGKVNDCLVYLLQHAGQAQGNTQGMADAYLKVVAKMRDGLPAQYRHHLARASWHNQLFAAELYCSARRHRRSWHALASAVVSWPYALLSPRTWYVLLLILTGPLYPQANRAGLRLRTWYRRRFGADSVTGWRASQAGR